MKWILAVVVIVGTTIAILGAQVRTSARPQPAPSIDVTATGSLGVNFGDFLP